MLLEAQLLKLDADTRAFTLVGAFMGYFALLEQGVDAAFCEVLGVKGARRAIISRNMTFDDKVKTLRSLVSMFVQNRTQAKKFDELARRARKFGEIRNVIAHTPFRGSLKSNGVEFFPIAANSRLEFPNMDWSIEDFLKRIDEINDIDNSLRQIERQMGIQRIAEALMATPSPLGGLFGLGGEAPSAEGQP